MSRLIVGIDPGFRATACAVYDLECKAVIRISCIETQTKKGKNARQLSKGHEDTLVVFALHHGLAAALQSCGNDFQLFVELPTGSQSARSARCIGMAYGAVIATVIPYNGGQAPFGVTPLEVRDVGGVHKDSKEKMIEWAREYAGFNEAVSSYPDRLLEHCADALAVAIAGHAIKSGMGA